MVSKEKESEVVHLGRVFGGFKDVHLRCFGINDDFANRILSKLSDFADKYNKSGPDMYSIYSNEVIGIEHFEYDASVKNRNGSKERREAERVRNVFQKETRCAFENGKKEFSKVYIFDANGDISTLKQNFLRGLEKHKTKIANYKKNIQDIWNTDSPEIWFLVEDTSIMGPEFHSRYFIDNQPEYPLLPVFYKDIQKEVLTSGIAGIIFMSTFPISRYVAFIKNDKKSFRELQEHYHFNKNTPIQFFNDSLCECRSFIVKKSKK